MKPTEEAPTRNQFEPVQIADSTNRFRMKDGPTATATATAAGCMPAEIAPTHEPARWREVFQGRLGRLTTGLLIVEAVATMEVLIVATVLPDVEKDLRDIQWYGWAFSATGLATLGVIPIAGRLVDQLGPRRPFAVITLVYAAGLAISGLAPSMQVLVVGRFVQGCAAGAFFPLELGTVAKSYPERLRARALALLTSMWIVPGLVAPSIGAFIANTVGWRWAFLGPIPLILGLAVLILPAFGSVEVVPQEAGRVPILRPLVLMIGAGLLLAGLTEASASSALMVPVGLALCLPALTRIAPRGLFRVRPGLPAAAAAAFLLSAAIFSVDGFLTLMLTRVRGLSLGRASVIVTLGTIAWAVGSWWQSRNVERIGVRRIVAWGAVSIAVGTIAVASALVSGISSLVAYLGWTVAGIGMGAAFPSVPLAAMTESTVGREAGELSSVLLLDNLGFALGAGLGGASIAIAKAQEVGLRPGLAGAYLVGLVAAMLLVPVAARLPESAPE